MVLELRPAHDPRRSHGFVGVVVSTEELSAIVMRAPTATMSGIKCSSRGCAMRAAGAADQCSRRSTSRSALMKPKS